MQERQPDVELAQDIQAQQTGDGTVWRQAVTDDRDVFEGVSQHRERRDREEGGMETTACREDLNTSDRVCWRAADRHGRFTGNDGIRGSGIQRHVEDPSSCWADAAYLEYQEVRGGWDRLPTRLRTLRHTLLAAWSRSR